MSDPSHPSIRRQGLPSPIGPMLRDAADEGSVRRIWAGIQATRGGERRHRRRWVAAGVALSAAAALVLWVTSAADSPVGPLTRADGSLLAGVLSAGPRIVRVHLGDASWITLAPETRLEVLASSDTAFTTLLSMGRARFDVVPGGPRRWVVECGLASVEVVGTSFTVERTSTTVIVRVHRGAVLVRSDHLPDGVARLSRGGRVVVRAREVSSGPTIRDAAPRHPPPVIAPPASPATQSRAQPSRWRRAASRRDFRAAYAELGHDGLLAETRRAGARDLLVLADVARLGGHPEDAVAPLERILAEHPGDRQAPIAAFTLGRLELDTLGRPLRAAEAFDRAVSLGAPAALREDAYARRVEAWARAGRRADAADAAAAYLEAFPDGRHRAAVERWVGR